MSLTKRVFHRVKKDKVVSFATCINARLKNLRDHHKTKKRDFAGDILTLRMCSNPTPALFNKPSPLLCVVCFSVNLEASSFNDFSKNKKKGMMRETSPLFADAR
jgi:hypothetical protein